ncbi:helix-turn-helix domain-containing protein [Sphingomonas kaistensis]|uniref:Helix-turn-helix domain-containing protein n=1 Tax=Sphingomonas kaistensis TaxID=298708 RepID=A0ABZ2G128_9SPHN
MAGRDVGLVQAFQATSDACPIPEAVAVIGERWTCLIIRASMLGLRHFEEFQSCLGIARNILSDRLGRLVSAGILARSPDPEDGRKVIYGLTERGAALVPVMVALRQWALDAGLGKPGHPELADRRDRKPVARITVHAHDGRQLDIEDLVWIGSDGAELQMPSPPRARQVAA